MLSISKFPCIVSPLELCAHGEHYLHTERQTTEVYFSSSHIHASLSPQTLLTKPKSKEFQEDYTRAFNQAWRPSKHRVLGDCRGHMPMRLLLTTTLHSGVVKSGLQNQV